MSTPPSKPNGKSQFDLLMTPTELASECPQLFDWLMEGKFHLRLNAGEDRLPVIRVDEGYNVRFYTDRHVYHVIAYPPGRSDGKSYLGCTVSTRKPRAGESHGRGNDLADGLFTLETWHKILADIVSYELVPLESQAAFEEIIRRSAEWRKGVATVAAEKVLP
jgi:hypothetical protein